jgi:hypothetical protein
VKEMVVGGFAAGLESNPYMGLAGSIQMSGKASSASIPVGEHK